jgi:hypothetical protein
MSLAHHPRLALESLDHRIVPAVLDLTTHGAVATAPSGAIVQQNDTPPAESLNPFVRMQASNLLGGLLGGLLGTGTQQGYNTNARPLQYDEDSDPQLTHAITLGDVPVVTVNGVSYREFHLTINQTSSSPYLSLDEVRVFLDASPNLSGYSQSTKKLAGRTAVFNLDAGGDVTVRLNDNLTPDSSTPDMVLLIPNSAFGSASADTFVYLYSKFGGQAGAAANGGFEEWAVRDIPLPPPPPPPPPTTASLSGSVYIDVNHNGVWDGDESGLAGVTVTLQGFDYLGNAVSLEVQTGEDGTFQFTEILAGTYTLAEQPQFGYASGTTTAGSEGGDVTTPGQVSNITIEDGDAATDYIFGEVYSE